MSSVTIKDRELVWHHFRPSADRKRVVFQEGANYVNNSIILTEDQIKGADVQAICEALNRAFIFGSNRRANEIRYALGIMSW